MYLIALSQKNIPSAYVSKAYSDSPDYARERFREWYWTGGGAIERRDFWCSALVSVVGFFNLATVIAQNSTEQVLEHYLSFHSFNFIEHPLQKLWISVFRVLYISACAFFSVSLMFFIFAVNCVLRDYDSENKLLFSLPPFVSESNHSILSCGPNFTRCFGDLLISSGALRCAQREKLRGVLGFYFGCTAVSVWLDSEVLLSFVFRCSSFR